MKICLDAGHYNKYNHSPVNQNYYESYFTWDFHLLLKDALQKYGIEVITTRDNQKNDLGLEARGRKSKGCDLFLSIHSNACDDPRQDHPLACCTVTHKADELGQKLADTVAVVMDTNQNGRYINKSQGDGRDWYGVLRGAASVGTPGILLEHSFHTNLRATDWLLNKDNLKLMAEAEAKTIADHFGVSGKPKQDDPNKDEKPKDTPKIEEPKKDYLYRVKVRCNALNVRREPKVAPGNVVQIIRKNEVYTIVEQRGNWGKLKSGAGWINVSPEYVTKQ